MEYHRCSETECANVRAAKGLCASHYAQAKRGAFLGPVKQVPAVSCSFGECPVVARNRGLCHTHYAQQRKEGKLTAQLKIKGSSLVRNADGNKLCCHCKQWLPENQFGGGSKSLDKLASYCSRCTTLRAFNMNRNDYDLMLSKQSGVCAICACAPDNDKMLTVDHDHSCCDDGRNSCGKCVRGLLCNMCNAALGMMRDDPQRLRAGADYLDSF